MQALAAHQLRHLRGVRALDDAFFGDDRIDQVCRRHVKYRVERFNIRPDALAADFQQLGATTMKRTPWCMALTAS